MFASSGGMPIIPFWALSTEKSENSGSLPSKPLKTFDCKNSKIERAGFPITSAALDKLSRYLPRFFSKPGNPKTSIPSAIGFWAPSTEKVRNSDVLLSKALKTFDAKKSEIDNASLPAAGHVRNFLTLSLRATGFTRRSLKCTSLLRFRFLARSLHFSTGKPLAASTSLQDRLNWYGTYSPDR